MSTKFIALPVEDGSTLMIEPHRIVAIREISNGNHRDPFSYIYPANLDGIIFSIALTSKDIEDKIKEGEANNA